jgi:hypothetical protein
MSKDAYHIGSSRSPCGSGEFAEYEIAFTFLPLAKDELSSELNTPSQSVLPIIHHILERLQRDFVKKLPDSNNHLVFPGEILSFQVLFQVTERREVARCEVGKIRCWGTRMKPSALIVSMDILEVCGLALST